MVLVVVVANCLTPTSLQSQKSDSDLRVHSFYLSSKLLKIELPKILFAIFVILSNYFKSSLKLRQWKRSLRRKRRGSRRWRWLTSLWRPRLQRQNVDFFCCSLCLSCIYSLNFCSFSLDYLCNFSKKLFGDGKRQKLVCKK